jgi:hypothetical protein
MPIIPTIEPPLGRWSARAEFDFDVFAALEPVPDLLTELLLLAELVIVDACGEDQERH